MDDPGHLATLVPWCAFALAVVFGWVASQSHFCTMGAISDAMNIGDWSRLRMWALALGIAVLATNGMMAAGWFDLSKSLYTGERLIWLSHVVGGLLFGAGMTLASGCGARNLVRLGGGNLKSLVVLICLGGSAYMTMKGLFAPFRVNVLDAVFVQFPGGQDLPHVLCRLMTLDTTAVRIACATVLGLCFLGFALADGTFRSNREYLVSALVIGGLVAAGWYVTAHLGYLAEDPNTLNEAYVGTNTRRPESFTYVGPVAYLVELLLLWTDASLRITFGIAAVAGLFVGALAQSLFSRRWRWEGFTTAEDLRYHMIGGVLMGFGGVCALGCTIGQGISGISTLALGSFLTLISIVAGCVATMKWLYWKTA